MKKKPAPRDNGDRVRLEAYMRPTLLRAVEDLAGAQDKSVSALTREALHDVLRKHGRPVPEK